MVECCPKEQRADVAASLLGTFFLRFAKTTSSNIINRPSFILSSYKLSHPPPPYNKYQYKLLFDMKRPDSLGPRRSYLEGAQFLLELLNFFNYCPFHSKGGTKIPLYSNKKTPSGSPCLNSYFDSVNIVKILRFITRKKLDIWDNSLYMKCMRKTMF